MSTTMNILTATIEYISSVDDVHSDEVCDMRENTKNSIINSITTIYGEDSYSLKYLTDVLINNNKIVCDFEEALEQDETDDEYGLFESIYDDLKEKYDEQYDWLRTKIEEHQQERVLALYALKRLPQCLVRDLVSEYLN